MANQDDDALMDISLFQALHASMTDAVYLINPENAKVVWVNRAGYENLRMTESEVLNHPILNFQKELQSLEHWLSIAAVIRNNRKFIFIGNHTRKDGTEFPIEVSSTVFEHQGQEFFLSIVRDISARRALEAETQGRADQIWFAVNTCTDGLWDWEISSGHVYFSPQMKRMLGYGPEEMEPVVDTWKDNVHPEDLAMVLQALDEHIQGKRERYEAVYRIKNRHGHYIWVHDLGCVSLRASNGEPIRATGMLKDITDYKQQEFKLQELAAYDELTKLRNRREFSRIFDLQLAAAKHDQTPLSLCLIDLDHFKKVNDQYGHLAGDFALKEIARLLATKLRSGDFLFRWGGEEFALICSHTDSKQIIEIADELRDYISQKPLNNEHYNLNISGSFGVATYPTDGNNLSELILAADSALYQAKSEGRNCVRSPQQAIDCVLC